MFTGQHQWVTNSSQGCCNVSFTNCTAYNSVGKSDWSQKKKKKEKEGEFVD